MSQTKHTRGFQMSTDRPPLVGLHYELEVCKGQIDEVFVESVDGENVTYRVMRSNWRYPFQATPTGPLTRPIIEGFWKPLTSDPYHANTPPEVLDELQRAVARLIARAPTASAPKEQEAAHDARVKACLAACTGMTDPEREVAELRKQRDELHAACAATYVLMEWLDTQDDDTGFLPREIANWLVDMWPEMRAISGPMKYTHAVDRAFIKIGKSIGMKVGQFNETSIREALGTIDAIKNAGGGQ
jgi:hypothetical protein